VETPLLDLVYSADLRRWTEQAQAAFAKLYGGSGGRYPSRAEGTIKLRAPVPEIPFAALINPSNPPSGPYGGMSFVICPVESAPSLVAMIAGTQGLSPDEAILARPGHARRVQAICSWLNKKADKQVAWAKQDPVRIDLEIPAEVKRRFAQYASVFGKYGSVIYAVFAPNGEKSLTDFAVKALLDLTLQERGVEPLKDAQVEAKQIECEYFAHLLPSVDEDQVAALLANRRYVILEGPPGTGKTRMAYERILHGRYAGHGSVIQFHPNTTYENFVGGLAPVSSEKGLGFAFAPCKGALMRAAESASRDPSKPFLLVIDEINRADLGKVLGEAIYLLEPEAEKPREINLAYDFGAPFGAKLQLPSNLHILGTMNSADRSIAIVDVAVRRRFGFVPLWPQADEVSKQGGKLMQEAFQRLLSIFVEYATADAFNLMPGHSYFLVKDDNEAARSLRINLAPLLREYLAQGYVAAFSDSVRAYLQWLESVAHEA
jgi:5-methylcytosine-specific restriction protein B